MASRRFFNPVEGPQVDNDPLTVQAGEAGTWGLPSQPQRPPDDPGAALPPEGFDYANGIILGDAGPDAANVSAPPEHPHLLRAPTNEPRAFQVPHEATHRRFEPPKLVSISQAAAGFSLLAPASQGLHYIKLLGLVLSLDAAGTVKFVVSGMDAGTITADITGTIGVPINGSLILPVADTAEPWLWTPPDVALGIFTVTGKAQGWAVFCYSPYDS